MEYRSEIRAPYAGFIRDVRERAVSVVVVENVLAILRHIKIREAVIIIIAPYAAQSVGIAWHAGFFRDVREGAVSLIAVKRVARVDASLVEIAPVNGQELPRRQK